MNHAALPINTPTIAARLHALAYSLSRSRFSVIVLLVGLGLLLSDQGRDVLIAYVEDGKTLRVSLAAAFWALSIWGWSRLLLDVRYDELPSCISCYNWCRKWIPRILGSTAFLVVAFSAYQSNQLELVWWALAGFVVFIILVVRRRPAERRLAAAMGNSSRESFRKLGKALEKGDIGPDSVPPYEDFMEMLGIHRRNTPIAKAGWKFRALLSLSMFLMFLLLSLMAIFNPVALGNMTGPLILFFLWGATWLPLGSWMSYVADKRGVPLIFLLIIVALLSSYYNDNHEIRHAQEGVAVETRPSVTDALDIWAKANPATGKNSATPFVVVATAGGGIRAAYWTATVLGDLHDKAPLFSQRTFALSGVSGGSVGATVYRALLDVPAAQLRQNCSKGMMECTQKILGKDFLGPLTAALLYPDLAQRFFPIALFPDRAAALEKSWEKSFNEVALNDNLNTSLGKLGSRAGAPSLFLNATWDDNGRRIVASNLRYAKNIPDETEAFILSNDQLGVIGYDLRLSTAAHNSARFPFVSPPGMWQHDGKIAGRLQDGGLFENYGAETALEILDLACSRFACPDADDRRKKELQNIIPVVILITSDPSLPENLAASSTDYKPVDFGYEVRSTFNAYEQVRSGRGAESAYSLQGWTYASNGKFFTFRMCKTDAEAGRPPLGWALSEAAKATINSYLFGNLKSPNEQPSCFKDNARESRELIRLLSEK